MIDVTVDDFLAGVIAACRVRGIKLIQLQDDFYERVAASYELLQELAPTFDLSVRFAVVLDTLHRDSPLVEQAVATAAQRKLVSLDNPEFVNMRIKLDRESAARLLEQLPGGDELFGAVAKTFVQAPAVTV